MVTRKLREHLGGQPSFATLAVIGVLIAAYAIYPAPFHNGFRWATDAVFSSLAEATKTENKNPIAKPDKPYNPRDPQAGGSANSQSPQGKSTDTKKSAENKKKKQSKKKQSTKKQSTKKQSETK